MKLVWDECIHHQSLDMPCAECGRTTHDSTPHRLLLLPDGRKLAIPGASPGTYIQSVDDPDPNDVSEAMAYAEEEFDVGPALVVLARLSSACMEQARWFGRPIGNSGALQDPVASAKWAKRAEELLEWVFDEYTAKQLAWDLLELEEELVDKEEERG